jgi:hypothetical protein
MDIKTAVFWDVTLCGIVDGYQHFREYRSSQHMKALCSSAALGTIYWTTHHIPEHGSLNGHRLEQQHKFLANAISTSYIDNHATQDEKNRIYSNFITMILWHVRVAPLIIVGTGSLKSIYWITQR